MMESGTTSVYHGRIPLDHGTCTKMARLQHPVKALKQVGFLVSLLSLEAKPMHYTVRKTREHLRAQEKFGKQKPPDAISGNYWRESYFSRTIFFSYSVYDNYFFLMC